MHSPLKKDSFPFRWFKWVPVAILLVAALGPAFWMTFQFIVDRERITFQWGQYGFSLLLMIVPVTSLALPIIGGILGLLVAPLVFFGIALTASFAGGLTNKEETFVYTMTTCFIVGGLLSIIYGIVRWRWRRKQRKKAVD